MFSQKRPGCLHPFRRHCLHVVRTKEGGLWAQGLPITSNLLSHFYSREIPRKWRYTGQWVEFEFKCSPAWNSRVVGSIIWELATAGVVVVQGFLG